MFVLNQRGKYMVNYQYLNGMISGSWKQFDSNNDSYLDREEFRSFINQLIEESGAISDISDTLELDRNTLDSMFNRVEVSGDGTISKIEMATFLKDLFNQIAVQKNKMKKL